MNIYPPTLTKILLKTLNRKSYRSYKEMVNYRLKEKSYDKPISLQSKFRRIDLYFIYSSENYTVIHDSLTNAFRKTDIFNRLNTLKEDQKNITQLGWQHIGYIFPRGKNEQQIGSNILLVDDLPEYVESVVCRNHKILPSTSVLVFDINLNENFSKCIYENFYSEEDIIILFEKNFKVSGMSAVTSGQKFEKALNAQIEILERWFLNFFKIERDSILSFNRNLEVSLKNFSQKKSNDQILNKNIHFFSGQRSNIFGVKTFCSDETYYLLDDLSLLKTYTFTEIRSGQNILKSHLDSSIFLLMITDAYRKKFEYILEKNSSHKNIETLKTDVLVCNEIAFQISRLFEEIKNTKIIQRLSKHLKYYNLLPSLYVNTSNYDKFFVSRISSASIQLTEKAQAMNKYLDKEFQLVSTQVNFKLQKEMKNLTRATICIAILSVIVTCLNTDWKKAELILNSVTASLISFTLH